MGDDGTASGSGSGLPPHLNPRLGQPARPARPARTVVPGEPASRKIPRPHRTRRHPLLRMLSFVAVFTSFAVLVTAGGGYALVNHYDGNVTRLKDALPGRNSPDRPPPAPRDARNVLIVGSDDRGDLEAGEGVQGTGKDFVKGQRSDTVILAHLYGDSDKAQLISFPRDSWVTIPAYTDVDTGETVPEDEGKLNKAFFEGGPPLLIRTIEGLSGVRVDSFLQIDFDGFQQLVNTLGGVEVCLSKPAKEKDSGIDLPAGRQTIKGDQALAFVRQRQGLPGGDLDRIRRQQQFIGAIVRKVLSAGTLLNPLKLNGVIKVATNSIQVDESLTDRELLRLAQRFQSFSAGGVSFNTVPFSDTNATRDRQSVVLLDEPKVDALFAQVRADLPPDTPKPAASPGAASNLIVAPENIRVKVYNGTGTAGLGRRGADELAAVGFQVVGQPDNRGTSATTTTVRHGSSKADSARTLAAAIPGAKIELDTALGSTLEVVLGSGYSGAKQVTVSGQAPKPAATASPEVKTAAEDPCTP